MMRATMVSLSCNVVLVTIKSVTLALVNSLAIALDLGISFVGLTVSVILFYSIRLANRPADVFHNYGYGKVEHVCEALEGLVLIGIALAMSFQAMTNLLHPTPVVMPGLGLLSCTVNATINFGGGYYILQMAKKSGSPAIRAEGIHYGMEGVISSMIGGAFLIAMLLKAKNSPLVPYIDPMAALLVSLVLIIPSFKIAKGSFFNLLDASVEEDSQLEILKPLGKYIQRYCEFRDLRTRTAGRNKFVEFKLIVPEDISFRAGHELVSILENEIKSAIQNCEVMIKMEPCQKDCETAQRGEKCPYL